MKVSALTKIMNDYGTKPRVKVMRHTDGATILSYEGAPQNIDAEIGALKVNSFTVLGKGFIEVHTN